MSSVSETAESADLMAFVLLQVMTDICVELGLDPDGSLTTGRALAVLGSYEQISKTAAAGPWGPQHRKVRRQLTRTLKRNRALMSRLVMAGRTAPD